MAFNSVREKDFRSVISGETKAVLREMFTETGMETVAYYLSLNYGVSLDDSWRNPSRFQDSLVLFLGDFGGKIILRRLIARICAAGRLARPLPGEMVDLPDCVTAVLSLDVSTGESVELTR